MNLCLKKENLMLKEQPQKGIWPKRNGFHICLYFSATKELAVYERWLSELLSLGVAVHRSNKFNDIKEIRSLTDNLKRYYQMDSRNSPR
jgi:hypothetical protein